MWKIEYDEKAVKELLKIDKSAAIRIKKYLDEKIATDADPRRYGEVLAGNLAGLWKYRVGDYRIIADIQDDRFIVLVVRVGHRRKIYGDH